MRDMLNHHIHGLAKLNSGRLLDLISFELNKESFISASLNDVKLNKFPKFFFYP